LNDEELNEKKEKYEISEGAKIFQNQSTVEIKKMEEDIIIEESESESISA
jgi:hypothetical protein